MPSEGSEREATPSYRPQSIQALLLAIRERAPQPEDEAVVSSGTASGGSGLSPAPTAPRVARPSTSTSTSASASTSASTSTSTSTSTRRPVPRSAAPAAGPAARRHRRWRGEVRQRLQTSPAYAVAGFLHLALLVGLSFWTVAIHLQEPREPIEARLLPVHEVVPVTDGLQREAQALEALLDSTERDLVLPAESAREQVFAEAASDAAGAVNVLGLGSGARGGAGRGGATDRRGGASRASEGALAGGLDWLARHRTELGVWEPIAPGRKHGRLRGGSPAHTGLALMAFVFSGHGPEREGPYQELVLRAQDWLAAQVDERGHLSPTLRWQRVYHEAITTIALAECLARRPSPELRQAVGALVAQLQRSRHIGWRYDPTESDTSVTSWVVLGLKSAKGAGVEVSPRAFEGAREWLEQVSHEDGATCYQAGGRVTPAMTATGLFLRVLLGEPPTTSRNRRAAARVTTAGALQVGGDGISNLYQLYYSALALYQVGGEPWRVFNARVRDGLVSAQRRGSGCERGSWGGGGYLLDTVAATAFATLTLETYYRYLPVHEGVDLAYVDELAAPALSPGEQELEVAESALVHAQSAQDPGALLAAEAGFERALATLRRERADWEREGRARARLVELATLAPEGEARDREVRRRLDEYLAAAPSRDACDPRLLALERRLRFGELLVRARDALEHPTRAADAEAALNAFVREQEPRLRGREGERARGEAARQRARAQELALALAFAHQPRRAAREAAELLEAAPLDQPAEQLERRLLGWLVEHAAAEAAREDDPEALRAAREALALVASRCPDVRLGEAERAAFVPRWERARLAEGLALLRAERLAEAAEAARALARAHPGGELVGRARSLEQAALVRRLQRGEATAPERARLVELLRDFAGRHPDLPAAESLALGELLLAAGASALAQQTLTRALTLEATAAERASARLGLARLARAGGQPRRAWEHLRAIDGEQAQRLDVFLERCLLLRAEGQHTQAAEQYVKLLRALEHEDQDAWWHVAEETARTYAEGGMRAEARHFLEGLRLRDPQLGGPQRRARLIALMREVE